MEERRQLLRLPTTLWEQAMSADGLHLLGDGPRPATTDQAWQQGNIEAPAMTAAAGHGYWLFYSGGSWRTPDYATGVAYCAKVEGPCHEVRGTAVPDHLGHPADTGRARRLP